MHKSVKPSEFFGDNPPSRIISTESECPIQKNGHELNQYITSRAIKRAGHVSADGYLDSGPRIYDDAGNLEISAAEMLGPRMAAAGDKAAIILLAKVVKASGVPHRGLHRHSGTAIGNNFSTTGYHINYAFPRSIADSTDFDTIMASQMTSDVWSKSGIVKDGFEFSQKVSDIGEEAVIRVLDRRNERGRKPMAIIPTSREDAGTIGDSRFARFERRYADPGFSLTNNYLKFAADSLVLRMLEHPKAIDLVYLREHSFEDPVDTARYFNNDLTFSKVALTLDGDQISALDYQEILISSAYELADRIHLPEDELAAIDLWATVHEELSGSNIPEGDYGKLLGLLDFAPRHRYLTTHFTPEELKSTNHEAVEAQLNWDRIAPAGTGMEYWSRVPSPYVSDDEVQYIVDNPPPTRASERGRLISDRGSQIIRVNWSGVTTQYGKIRLNDAWDTGER